ncbi:MAG: Hsp20/alpha crystallin family protein [Planctomycetota bacterium]|nr:MAG: Hsp20/alpha crystallin family protein [Planctomycetota bacterium]
MDMLFERFFRDPWGALEDFGDGGSLLTAMPRMDVAESDKDVTVTLELPGVDPKDLDIRVSQGVLTVQGEKKREKEEKDRNYHWVEREYGSFHRTVPLPNSVDPEKVEATYENGVLTVTLAKQPGHQQKRVEVKAK